MEIKGQFYYESSRKYGNFPQMKLSFMESAEYHYQQFLEASKNLC